MAQFHTTRWSLVLQAREGPEARRALEALCKTYRPAVLSYIRAHGHDPDAAEDLAQSFLEHFIERTPRLDVTPERGRFRSFLLVMLRRFLLDQHDRAGRVKRGGRVRFDTNPFIGRISGVADGGDTPERAFRRAWVRTVVESALRRLRAEAKASGKVELFDQLSEFLGERPEESEYARVAGALNMRRNTLAVAVHRLRLRLRELVREQLADTAASEAEMNSELRELNRSLGAIMQ